MISEQQIQEYFPEHYNLEKGHRLELEKMLQGLLHEAKNGAFLEIGLGPKVRVERAKLLKKLNIQYTGLDFQTVCDEHQATLTKEGVTDLEFIGNSVGTYLYNLIRLQRLGRKFDVIYLDGHHTMYTDFPAAFACMPLLKEGGVIAFDDVRWTLANKEKNLKNSEFYKEMYDFSLYEQSEKEERHIEVIIKEYLIPMFDMSIYEKYSLPSWIALQRKTK
ncbi:hypothetical protein KUL17_21640 [Alteromonas sp. KUL17]|uniref:class I SAM-dependent methyltransferase n=1 Tax=Alteromonas sp. KUL17 TaxID=2480796 RepID=UPI0010FFB3B1|nr:class I SAM-dependent methyltransferase [Alteromonas sp. KUL17]GEA03267.1 hypothetical protein KUL17_21640 [Alteromonas sp. KUL17]